MYLTGQKDSSTLCPRYLLLGISSCTRGSPELKEVGATAFAHRWDNVVPMDRSGCFCSSLLLPTFRLCTCLCCSYAEFVMYPLLTEREDNYVKECSSQGSCACIIATCCRRFAWLAVPCRGTSRHWNRSRAMWSCVMGSAATAAQLCLGLLLLVCGSSGICISMFGPDRICFCKDKPALLEMG